MELFRKSGMVAQFGRYIEKDTDDILFCFYAGDSQSDVEMAYGHKTNETYKHIPHAFMHTGGRNEAYIEHNAENSTKFFRVDPRNKWVGSCDFMALTSFCHAICEKQKEVLDIFAPFVTIQNSTQEQNS